MGGSPTVVAPDTVAAAKLRVTLDARAQRPTVPAVQLLAQMPYDVAGQIADAPQPENAVMILRSWAERTSHTVGITEVERLVIDQHQADDLTAGRHRMPGVSGEKGPAVAAEWAYGYTIDEGREPGEDPHVVPLVVFPAGATHRWAKQRTEPSLLLQVGDDGVLRLAEPGSGPGAESAQAEE